MSGCRSAARPSARRGARPPIPVSPSGRRAHEDTGPLARDWCLHFRALGPDGGECTHAAAARMSPRLAARCVIRLAVHDLGKESPTAAEAVEEGDGSACRRPNERTAG